MVISIFHIGFRDCRKRLKARILGAICRVRQGRHPAGALPWLLSCQQVRTRRMIFLAGPFGPLASSIESVRDGGAAIATRMNRREAQERWTSRLRPKAG